MALLAVVLNSDECVSYYPMNGTEERDDDGSIAKLNWLDVAQEVVGGFVVNEDCIIKGVASRKLLGEIPSEEKRRDRGGEIRNGPGKTKELRLSRDGLETECFLDNALAKPW